MEKNLITQFNLPSYIKGKTFADASKAINNKFKDRNDKASNATKEELLSRLAQAQEYIKMQESLAIQSTEVPIMQDTPKEFAEGGSMASFNNYLDMGQDAISLGQDLFGKTGIETDGSQSYENVSEFGGAASGAMKGAQLGTKIAPGVGTAIGAVVGGVSGLVGAKRKNEDINDANRNFALTETANLRSDFGMGGKMKYKRGGKVNPLIDTEALDNMLGQVGQGDIDASLSGATILKKNNTTTSSNQSKFSKGVDWLGENFGNIAQYAPIAGNLLELKNLDKPITERGSRMDNVYKKDLFDTQSLINQVNQNNVNSALEEASTGNLGSLRTNILAANLNKDKAISEAVIKGDQINRDENRYEFQSNFNKDRINVGLDQNYLERRDRDMAMYETTKSNLKRQLFEDLGDIGREEVNKKLVKEMFGYKWNGKYYTDSKGNRYTSQEVAEKLKGLKDNG